MRKSCLRILSIFAVFLSLIITSSNFCFSQGNLLITPRRVVFDGSRRVIELSLVNTGSDSAKYNVSLVQYRMNEDGSFTEITEPDPGQRFADKNIRFFPRTVTLAPNEGQSVKMQVTNMEKLDQGEYRSHVYFRSVPNEKALGLDEINPDSTSVSIKLIPIFGITIPVIIRIGQDDTKVNISDFKFVRVNDTTNRVIMNINRVGNMSVYGDVKISYISPTGKEIQLGALNGISVYTPNKLRRLIIDLDSMKNMKFSDGKIKVTYLSQSDSKPTVFAESVIDLRL